MFKSLQSDNSIPNNYVYTSNRGTEYMYLEGSWVNCETMKIVENAHTFKMNQSAIRQIAEQNSKNYLQIGKKYVINESEYIYVGRDNFSLQGNLLSESMNTKIQRLVEADEDQGNEKTKEENTSSSDVPNGYVYKSKKGNNYYKKNGQWFNSATKKPVNSSSVPMLERSAQAEIGKFNSSSPVKIGEEFKSKKGITYHYVGGNRFISDNGKLLPPDIAQKVLANLSQKPSEQDSSEVQSQGEPQGSSTDTSNIGSIETGTSEEQPEQNSTSDSQDGQGGNDSLQSLANEIKSNPLAGKIVVLLSRGDDLSLLAADILLSGKQKEAAEILKSLNNED